MKRIVKRLVWPAVVALAVATGAGLASPIHWTLALADAPRLQYAVALVVLGLLAVLVRRWASVALAALAAAVNLAIVVPLWAGAPPEPDRDAATLDVVFFNTKIRSDADAVARWLASQDPDVAILAATTGGWADRMRRDSGMEVALSRPSGTDLELMILTAEEPLEAGIVDWKVRSGRDRGVETTVDVDGQPVRLLGIHPVSPVGASRRQRRDATLRRAAHWVTAVDEPSVIVGDLNAVPWSGVLQRLRAEAGLVDSLAGHGRQPSWPAPFAWAGMPLDHVLHTPDLVTVERELGPSFGSDHRLVRVRLALVE